MSIESFKREYPELFEELEERAAIMEYDGNMNRLLAEGMALQRLRDIYRIRAAKGEKTA